MIRRLDSLREIIASYDAVVLDQWGVLHDGSMPYPGAIAALRAVQAAGVRLAVLSNSGKRAAPNAARIAAMGFDAGLFETVMTSGEALWQDIAAGWVAYQRLFPITRDAGDAEAWAAGLDLSLTDDIAQAEAVLLMGLPDGAEPNRFSDQLRVAKSRNLPVLCTNPDRVSPRAGGVTVTSPGALAHDYADQGGDVRFYGKPHLPVFRAMEAALGAAPERLLMVGDSLEHDIAGGFSAGWDTAFIRGGLHADAFSGRADIITTITDLAAKDAAPLPTFTLAQLR